MSHGAMVSRLRVKVATAGIFLALLCAWPASLHAEMVLEQISPRLSLSASLRTRGEFWNWFEPSGTQNNDYAFLATFARAALQWKDDAFDVMLEGQNSSLLGLPDDATAPAPQGLLGLGGAYFAHNRRRDDTGIFIKQGFLTLKRLGIEGLTLKAGRFEFSEGSEVLTKDPTLDWLKNVRLGQRMIGPFGWAHVGRAYDGGVISLTRAPLNFTVMASHPTEGGFDLNGMDYIEKIDLAYAAVNLTRPFFAETSDARLFYIYYGDGRNLLKSDNRPVRVRTADKQDIFVHTQGAHWITTVPTTVGSLDFLAWGALQAGEWGTQDHQAWAWNLEAGWQPKMLPWKPWLRIGYSRTSGDDDPGDGDHDTFFQILPTSRIYAYSTFYNLMNNEDAFFQLILRPFAGLMWRTDFHNIRLTESRDLWYQGAGATIDDRAIGFGFPGRPAFGHRDLFQVAETSLSYDLTKWLTVSVYYVHVFGGRVVRAIYDGDDADFGYIELMVKL